MNNKLWLTSMVAIGLALPASAATFPATGYMQKSTTYTGAATQTNMGVASGTANADAYYDIGAGYYLPANSYEAAQCTAGNYCAGVTNIKSTTSAQGVTGACPSGFPNSDVGTYTVQQCYRSCILTDISNTEGVASNATVSGRVINNGGVAYCEPSACAAGYTKLPDYKTTITSTTSKYWSSYNGTITGTPTDNGSSIPYGVNSYWAADFGNMGMVWGSALVSNNTAKYIDWTPEAPTSANQGTACYCSLRGYNGVSLNSAWVRVDDEYVTTSTVDGGACNYLCAQMVADQGVGLTTFREDLFSMGSSSEICDPNVYGVIYSCGVGTGTNPPQGAPVYNRTYTVSLNTYDDGGGTTTYCTKEGYTFNNWKDGAGTTRTAGADITWTYTSAQTFTAQWKANTITLNWDENNGSAVSNGTCTYDSTLTLPAASTREGYTFAGWKLYGTNGAVKAASSTVANGCTKANTGVASGTSNAIKAQWTANTITLNWDENGGDAISNGTCTYDGTLTLPAAPTRAGYDFGGWKLKSGTVKDASSTVSSGCKKANTGVASGTSTEIVAQWTPKTITIKWYGVSDTGNTNGVFETTVTYGGDITTPTTPKMSASGQTFRGWVFRK